MICYSPLIKRGNVLQVLKSEIVCCFPLADAKGPHIYKSMKAKEPKWWGNTLNGHIIRDASPIKKLLNE